jgi:hypothetical protein
MEWYNRLFNWLLSVALFAIIIIEGTGWGPGVVP